MGVTKVMWTTSMGVLFSNRSQPMGALGIWKLEPLVKHSWPRAFLPLIKVYVVVNQRPHLGFHH